MEALAQTALMNHSQTLKLQGHGPWPFPIRNCTTTMSSTTTTPQDETSGDMIFTSLIVFMVAIVFLFFVRLGIGFCVNYREDHTCAETCRQCITMKWVCVECRRTGRRDVPGSRGDEENVSSSEVSQSNTSHSLYDLPDYEDALNLPRLDSTTIIGIPPPLYSSVVKETTEGHDQGHENVGFSPDDELPNRQYHTTINASDISPQGTVHLGDSSVADNNITPDVPPEGIAMTHRHLSDVVFPRALRAHRSSALAGDRQTMDQAKDIAANEGHSKTNVHEDRFVSQSSSTSSVCSAPVTFVVGDFPSTCEGSESEQCQDISCSRPRSRRSYLGVIGDSLDTPPSNDSEPLPSYEEATEINIGTDL